MKIIETVFFFNIYKRINFNPIKTSIFNVFFPDSIYSQNLGIFGVPFLLTKLWTHRFLLFLYRVNFFTSCLNLGALASDCYTVLSSFELNVVNIKVVALEI